MTDTARLDKIIEQSGYKLSFIADRLDISPYAFARKRNNLNEFTPTEINILCELLKIDSIEDRFAIFFAQKVDAESTNRKE